MRWSRLLLALVGCLAGLGGVSYCVSREIDPSRARAHPVQPRAPLASVETPDPIDLARARLEQFEAARRRATDFEHLAPANTTHGADPYALTQLDATHFVGVLRGASALVVLDSELRELQRIDIPGGAVSVAVAASGACWVAAETSGTLSRLRFDGQRLVLAGGLDVPGIVGFRAIAAGPKGLLYALDVRDGKLLTLAPESSSSKLLESRVIGHGPLSLERVGRFLIVDALLDHALIVFRLGSTGRVLDERARIHHDGPIWGFDAALHGDGELLIAATGVEDHPLERSDGSFGFIDSFAFFYVLPKQGAVRQLWRANVAELGVVTPKAPLLTVTADSARLFVTGFGSDRAAELFFDVHQTAPPRVQTEPFFPGTSAALRLPSGKIACADPLLDAWLLRAAEGEREEPAEFRPVIADSAPLSTTEERLGEALFFTTLMSPANSSEGAHSRFSCETCHFEGYVDGRVHDTGRDDVRVATKPLRGLFNNRPHFSRALDADLATVSHHEFRVAGKGNGQDPWFEVRVSDYPWLERLDVQDATLGPEQLRRALIAFLMHFSHTTNPSVVGREQFDESERRGAELFRARCTGCHAPRLQSDVAASALPFESWPGALFSRSGPIVWASAEYRKTGVTPYVHESGTRVPSLRRLYAKWPHFTNGSADTLLDVVTRVRFDEARLFHDHAPSDPTLRSFASEEARDLVAFLELL